MPFDGGDAIDATLQIIFNVVRCARDQVDVRNICEFKLYGIYTIHNEASRSHE